MDIRELDKKQLILLTLLITFVVSIATGIVTVSLMNQVPKSVLQPINNVIERVIEKVTTVQVPTPVSSIKDKSTENTKDNSISLLGNADALVSIYIKNTNVITSIPDGTSNTATDTSGGINSNEGVAIGQGIIISDIGLILVDSSLIKDQELYKVILDKTDFDASVLKKFDNGFTILKISPITDKITESTDTANKTQ